MTGEERSADGHQPHHQKRRSSWLRRASTSSDSQPPPPSHRSGRRLSAYDRIIQERVRRGITVNLERRSSVVSTASSDRDSVDSASGSSSGSGSGSGNGSGSRLRSGSTSSAREPADSSLRPLAPRADPLDESQMTGSGASHREGAARCLQADGVPLLDHLMQLTAERGTQPTGQRSSSTDSRSTETPDEKRVRFREGWRSARGTGSLSALHEDEVKSVAERMHPCGILKNGKQAAAKKEDVNENGDVTVGEATAEKLCKSVTRSAVDRIVREARLSDAEKASETSSVGEVPAGPTSHEHGYESDDVFETKTGTSENVSDNVENKPNDSEIEEALTPATQNTSNGVEKEPSLTESSKETDKPESIKEGATDDALRDAEERSVDDESQSHKETPEQQESFKEETKVDTLQDVKCPSADGGDRCKATDVSEPVTSDSDSKKAETTCEQPTEEDTKPSESDPAAPGPETRCDNPERGTTTASEDITSPCPPAASASSNKPRRTRLDSVPEEPPSSPGHIASTSSAQNHATSPNDTPAAEDAASSDPRPGALPVLESRPPRTMPSRRWSVGGELTSHRRDRAAVSRRLVYLALSEEDEEGGGEPRPVFQDPSGAAVEFDPRLGDWRPLTSDESRRLASRRRMSLTKTCSLDFDRIP